MDCLPASQESPERFLGGPAVGQLAQAPFAVYLLKFSREYETEADILGSQIMARAGYDPRDLANMFRTIERQGGGSGGFLSSTRVRRIVMRASTGKLKCCGSTPGMRDSREFAAYSRSGCAVTGRAPTMAEIQRSGQRYPAGENTGNYPNNPPSGRVEYPSIALPEVSIFNGGVQVSVPSNWRQINDGNSVWFVPEGGYGQSTVRLFSRTARVSVWRRTSNRNLQRATEELINSLAQGNNNLRMSGGYQRTTLSGRNCAFLDAEQRKRSYGTSGECAVDHDATTQRSIVLHDCRCTAERTQLRECV